MVFTAPKQLHSKLRSKKLFPLVSATKHKSSSSLVILNQVLGRTGELLLPYTHLPLSLVPCHSCPGKTLPHLDGSPALPPHCSSAIPQHLPTSKCVRRAAATTHGLYLPLPFPIQTFAPWSSKYWFKRSLMSFGKIHLNVLNVDSVHYKEYSEDWDKQGPLALR